MLTITLLHAALATEMIGVLASVIVVSQFTGGRVTQDPCPTR
jgi:hypothetical protein